MKYSEEYRDGRLSRKLIDRINAVAKKEIRLMEVCGTHTVSIFRSGIRSVLPETISLLSGPGCPVCVTAQQDIDAFIALSQIDNTIITTFGDLIRVPGTRSSLQREQADGRDIRIVYSTVDALEIARKNPDKNVVFLGVGFETTTPHHCRVPDFRTGNRPGKLFCLPGPQTRAPGPVRPDGDHRCEY